MDGADIFQDLMDAADVDLQRILPMIFVNEARGAVDCSDVIDPVGPRTEEERRQGVAVTAEVSRDIRVARRPIRNVAGLRLSSEPDNPPAEAQQMLGQI